MIEHVGIVYDAGQTIYVARATDPQQLGRWDVPVIERFGSQLCTTTSSARSIAISGFFTGAVFLSDFVPYTKARLDALAAPQRRWAAELLHVWFHKLGPRDWFAPDPQVDAMLRRRFARELRSLRHAAGARSS